MTLYNQMNGQNLPMRAMNQINPQAVQKVKALMQTVKGVQDPEQALQNLAKQNPNIAQIMQAANSVGGLKNLFYQQAQQMGIDPNDILSQLK